MWCYALEIAVQWVLGKRMQLPFHPHIVKLNKMKLKFREENGIIVASLLPEGYLLQIWPLLHFIIPKLIDHVHRTKSEYLRATLLPKQTIAGVCFYKCFLPSVSMSSEIWSMTLISILCSWKSKLSRINLNE